MTVLIIIFGALTLLAGLVIVINPEVIFGFLRNNLGQVGTTYSSYCSETSSWCLTDISIQLI